MGGINPPRENYDQVYKDSFNQESFSDENFDDNGEIKKNETPE